MRRIAICLLLLSLPLIAACKNDRRANTIHEHLTPARHERQVLDVHNLDPDSERGQLKIRKMRERKAKLDAADERMRKLAEDAARREAEEAEQ